MRQEHLCRVSSAAVTTLTKRTRALDCVPLRLLRRLFQDWVCLQECPRQFPSRKRNSSLRNSQTATKTRAQSSLSFRDKQELLECHLHFLRCQLKPGHQLQHPQCGLQLHSRWLLLQCDLRPCSQSTPLPRTATLSPQTFQFLRVARCLSRAET